MTCFRHRLVESPDSESSSASYEDLLWPHWLKNIGGIGCLAVCQAALCFQDQVCTMWVWLVVQYSQSRYRQRGREVGGARKGRRKLQFKQSSHTPILEERLNRVGWTLSALVAEKRLCGKAVALANVQNVAAPSGCWKRPQKDSKVD